MLNFRACNLKFRNNYTFRESRKLLQSTQFQVRIYLADIHNTAFSGKPAIIYVEGFGECYGFCKLGCNHIPEEEDVLSSKEKQLFVRGT